MPAGLALGAPYLVGTSHADTASFIVICAIIAVSMVVLFVVEQGQRGTGFLLRLAFAAKFEALLPVLVEPRLGAGDQEFPVARVLERVGHVLVGGRGGVRVAV